MIVFALTLLAELIPLFLVISTAVYFALDALPPARLRRIIVGRGPLWRVPVATLFGALTPFCSCTTVPLIQGMRQAGVPTAPLVAFLIASPLVSPVAIVLLWSVIGLEYAVLYTGAGLVVATLGGLVVSWWESSTGESPAVAGCRCATALHNTGATWRSRLARAGRASVADLRKLAVPLGIAIAIGAAVHGYVPSDLLVRVAGPDSTWAVPGAAVVSVPVYASVAVLLPLGSSLLAKGVGIGAVTAFLMGASGFSLPEGILLSRILPLKLLLRVLLVFAIAIVLIGLLFQAVGQ